MVKVVCPPEAATAVKSYSPDLIVEPILTRTRIEDIKKSICNQDSVVIGPGLGRGEEIKAVCVELLQFLAEKKIYTVVDADGLHAIRALASRPQPSRLFESFVLTPNSKEYEEIFIYRSTPFQITPQTTLQYQKSINPALTLKSVVFVLKGETDRVKLGEKVVEIGEKGAARRCGGQGDVLAGIIGAFLAFRRKGVSFMRRGSNDGFERQRGLGSDSITEECIAACVFMRRIARSGFRRVGRSVITADLVDEIPLVVKELFRGEDEDPQ